jgi:DNA-directed RNA polymerase subunit K/omega
VAAQRAKQLRRGALPRLAHLAPDSVTGERPTMGKLERVAMEEVRLGLIPYEVEHFIKAAEENAS